jgi:hypothetical protein
VVATSPPAYTQGGTYSASLDRLHQFTADALPNQSLTFAVREGCFAGRMPAFSNPSGWNVTVGPCAGFVTNDSAASVGDYKWCNPSNAAVVLTASSGTLNRIDLIGMQVKDNFLDSSGFNTATVIVVQGTAVSGTASPPALPNSFIPLVQANVPAGSSTPTLSLVAVRTGASGSVLPVANATERATITTPYEGQTIWRIDRRWLEVYSAAAIGWLVVGNPFGSSIADISSAVSTPYAGQMAVTTAGLVYIYIGGVWTLAEGVVGGKWYVTTTTLAISSAGTEFLANVDTGSVALDPNSTYQIDAIIYFDATVAADTFDLLIRDGSLTGTVLNESVLPAVQASVPLSGRISAVFKTTTAVTKTFVLTFKRVTGTGSMSVKASPTQTTLMTITKLGSSTLVTSV